MKYCPTLLLPFFFGCALPFSRPAPTESQYKERFLNELESDEIRELQFVYSGAVGGEISLARFVANTDSLAKLRASSLTKKRFNPQDRAAIQALKERFRSCAGGRVPEWFDFPYNKAILVFEDKGGYAAGQPAYSNEWYVDEEAGIVYSSMTRG